MTNRTDRKLDMQGLEQRQMMAGDVAAFVQDGELVIEGDELGNRINIDRAGGMIQVSSLDGQTDVNGSPFANLFNPQQAGNEFDRIRVEMGDGNDEVQFDLIRDNAASRSEIDMGVVVRMGEGVDRVGMEDWNISHHAHIGSDGFLHTNIRDSKFGDLLLVAGERTQINDVEVSGSHDEFFRGVALYEGNSQIVADGIKAQDIDVGLDADGRVTLRNLDIDNRVNINGQTGGERVSVSRSDIGGDLSIRTFRYDNPTPTATDFVWVTDVKVGDDLSVDTGTDSGRDFVSLVGSKAGDRVDVRTGAGADVIFLDRMTSGNDIEVRSRGGNDGVTIQNATVGDDINIYAGEGNDVVTVQDSEVKDRIWARMDGGDDELHLIRTSVNRLSLNGRTGFDELVLKDMVYDQIAYESFESILK